MILLRGANRLSQTICYKIQLSYWVNILGWLEHFSDSAEPVFLYLLIILFTILEKIFSWVEITICLMPLR